MRVLVTGAAGFVGRHLLPALVARGHQVVATDRELEVSDPAAVDSMVRESTPGGIVHLAAVSSVTDALADAERTYRVNFLGARSILEAARRAGRVRVLLVGSSEVYGAAAPGSAPFDERAPLRPRSPYALTKSCADLLGQHYARAGVDVVCVRPFNHVGPGQLETFVAASFALQAARIAQGLEPPRIRVGNLDSERDFLDVEDVVEAYARLLEPEVPSGPYNVASGRGRPIRELLERLLALNGVEPEVIVDPARVRPTDRAVGDAGRLRTTTGWAPRVPFEHTLGRIVDDARERVRHSVKGGTPRMRGA